MAANAARQQMESALLRWIPGLNALWQTARFYFHVNSSYVVNKLSVVAFPWKKTSWRREVQNKAMPDGTTMPVPSPPISDVNAPDLYIPTMAFTTLLIVYGLFQGVTMK